MSVDTLPLTAHVTAHLSGRPSAASPGTGSTSADTPLPVLGRDVRVPLAGGGDAPYAALDYAASAPALQRVWDDVAAYAPCYGSVHRGAGRLSQLSTELYEQSRATVARFLGCRPGDQVIFTRATTDSLNLLAHVLPADTRVFVFETEHHAALLPWRDHRTRCLPAPRSPEQAVAALEAALRAAPAGPRLVCVTGASNVTGEIWPVRELARVARRHGARIVLDAAQLAPHHPVDIAALDVDWVALSGHKLYAPFGAGVLAGRADWPDAAPPYLAGGGAGRRVERGPDGGVAVEWHTGPARHEAGSPNVIGAYALASACRALEAAGFDRLLRREQRLLRGVLDGLAGVPGARVLSLFGEEPGRAGPAGRVGVVSFVAEGRDSAELAEALSAEYGIGARAGLFCAHPLLRVLLGGAPAGPDTCGAAGAPMNAVRVSFGAGTPDEHVDRLLTAVRALVRSPRG
ncbi:aminotransferase class V-fold PLP-dependent enzyme [Streptomyces sp. JJ36]|uniref:aminotransferase class V-fold PLP-dependent enzyme n=1 Tax=Streptomyces sp. JJ36 TaxID=2736645 RepID=UPI001F15B31E|nr:aminotransferase class V-fold PLP-dependent enzyme [Streptomyces sp. JJ36]MCF6522968.1 aminotransferase class V-fold PLP-dependent enzyme [Streptomyces sp. JJ36]